LKARFSDHMFKSQQYSVRFRYILIVFSVSLFSIFRLGTCDYTN